MPIYAILKNCVFGPDEISIIVAAYDQARAELNLHDRTDPLTELVASHVIEIAKTGERDPQRICKLAVQIVLGASNPR